MKIITVIKKVMELKLISQIQKNKFFIFFHLWNLDLKFYLCCAYES